MPSVFGVLLPARRTPSVAIAVTTVLAAALIATGDLTTLAETTVLLLVLVYAAVNACALALVSDPSAPRTSGLPRSCRCSACPPASWS